MTEPTDDELDAVIAEYRTRIYPQDMHPRFERAIMRAAIAKWGTPPAMPSGWVSCTIEFDGSGPEEVAYGPKIMMDRLAKWLGKHFERTIAEKAAPQPSPASQGGSVPAGVQQPAPSAAAAVNPDPHAELRKTWRPGQRWQARSFRNGQWGPWTDAVASEPFWFPHQDYRRHPDDLAPQPTPTPQADSKPAPMLDYPPLPDFDTVEQHIYGACRRYITQDMLEPIHNLIRDAIDADRAARAPADSVLEDAARYRYLRDVPMELWPAELLSAIRLQQNAKWDAAIDAARAAQEDKSHGN